MITSNEITIEIPTNVKDDSVENDFVLIPASEPLPSKNSKTCYLHFEHLKISNYMLQAWILPTRCHLEISFSWELFRLKSCLFCFAWEFATSKNAFFFLFISAFKIFLQTNDMFGFLHQVRNQKLQICGSDSKWETLVLIFTSHSRKPANSINCWWLWFTLIF